MFYLLTLSYICTQIKNILKSIFFFLILYVNKGRTAKTKLLAGVRKLPNFIFVNFTGEVKLYSFVQFVMKILYIYRKQDIIGKEVSYWYNAIWVIKENKRIQCVKKQNDRKHFQTIQFLKNVIIVKQPNFFQLQMSKIIWGQLSDSFDQAVGTYLSICKRHCMFVHSTSCPPKQKTDFNEIQHIYQWVVGTHCRVYTSLAQRVLE